MDRRERDKNCERYNNISKKTLKHNVNINIYKNIKDDNDIFNINMNLFALTSNPSLSKNMAIDFMSRKTDCIHYMTESEDHSCYSEELIVDEIYYKDETDYLYDTLKDKIPIDILIAYFIIRNRLGFLDYPEIDIEMIESISEKVRDYTSNKIYKFTNWRVHLPKFIVKMMKYNKKITETSLNLIKEKRNHFKEGLFMDE